MGVHRMVVAAVLLVLAGAPARADAVADFYKGKVVTLVVGYGSGGGYDVYGRLVALTSANTSRAIRPSWCRTCRGPAACARSTISTTPPPRTAPSSAPSRATCRCSGCIGNNPNVRFDPRKFTWLGSSSSYGNDAYLLFARKDAAVKSIADARTPGGPPLVLGGTAEGATGNDISTVLRDALGLNIRLIVGYPDSNALFLAVDRKEIGRPLRRPFGGGLLASRMAQAGQRHAGPAAVRARDPASGSFPTCRPRASSRPMRSRARLDRARRTALPAVAPVRGAAGPSGGSRQGAGGGVLAVHQDPEYLDQAGKLKVDVSPIGGEEVLRAIEGIAGAPPELLDYMRKLLSDNKNG